MKSWFSDARNLNCASPGREFYGEFRCVAAGQIILLRPVSICEITTSCEVRNT